MFPGSLRTELLRRLSVSLTHKNPTESGYWIILTMRLAKMLGNWFLHVAIHFRFANNTFGPRFWIWAHGYGCSKGCPPEASPDKGLGNPGPS